MNPRSAVTKAIRAHFYRGSFRQFVTDLTTGHGDLIVPAEKWDACVVPVHDGLGDALDDVMAMAEAAGVIAGRTDFDLWAAELDDNPLASGHYCPTCLTRLDKADRPCPLGCKENAR